MSKEQFTVIPQVFWAQSGLAAARPATTGLREGSLWYSTDTKDIDQVQGGAWVTVFDYSALASAVSTHEVGGCHRWTADKLLKGAGAGADPTEIDVPSVPTIVRKTADQIVNNSTALVNDNHLLLAVAANEVWVIRAILQFISTGTAKIKLGWAFPEGTLMFWKNTSEIKSVLIQTSTRVVDTEDVTLEVAEFVALIQVGATAGNINLQWAQGTAVVYDTKMKANSYLIGDRIA